MPITHEYSEFSLAQLAPFPVGSDVVPDFIFSHLKNLAKTFLATFV